MGSTAVRFSRRRLRALALTAGVLAAGAGPAAAAVAAGTYQGRSSQGLPVTLTIAGGRIKRLAINWNAKCAAVYRAWKGIETTHLQFPLSNGGWNITGHYTTRNTINTTRFKEVFSVADHGKYLGQGRFGGGFHGTLKVYRIPPGQTSYRYVTTCASGPVTFTLKRSA
jgi:hypothetical protein